MFMYSVKSLWSDEDECYIATVPELPGLSAFGETPEEATKEAKIAAEGYIKVLKEDGLKLPEPNKVKSFSGQTRLRLPISLHSSLSSEAEQEGVSLNTYITHLLSERNVAKRLDKKIDQIRDIAISNVLSTTPREVTATSGARSIVMTKDMWDTPSNPEVH